MFYVRRRTGAQSLFENGFQEELGEDKRGPAAEEN